MSDVNYAASIVIPTRNERENVIPLLQRLLEAIPSGSEVLFVDDSDDDTAHHIEAFTRNATQRPCDVRVIHRPHGQRQGGLGSAVIRGLREARFSSVCVMDADLQHPPETLRSMIAVHQRTAATLVVASRYSRGGHADGLAGGLRVAVSKSTTHLAKAMFPNRLRHVTDPMSGMFLVDRTALDFDRLRPHGFKVLLEVLAVTPGLTVQEVGYRFATRHAGESKASVREGVRFVTHVARLRCSSRTWSLRSPQLVSPAPSAEVGL